MEATHIPIKEGLATTLPVAYPVVTIITDSEQQISAFLRNDRELCLLVRPDRYIMAAFRIAEAAEITAAIRNCIGVIPSTTISPLFDRKITEYDDSRPLI
jgi:hypothetical protein